MSLVGTLVLIDSVSSIGDPMEQRWMIIRAVRIEAARQARSVSVVIRLCNRLEMRGQRIPADLKNFLAAHKHLQCNV